MKTLFAVYDSNDNFIKCSFSLLELGVSSLSRKLYRIPLDVQDDCFKEEDEAFLREFSKEAYTVKEQAKRKNISERTFYRHKKKTFRRKKMKNNLKPCPFCGNEEIKIETVISKKDILTDVHYCSIDFVCGQCKMVKNTKVYGVDEENCKKEAVRLWNRRVNQNESKRN